MRQKLTVEKLAAIRRAYERGITLREISTLFDVNRTTVGKMAKRLAWAEPKLRTEAKLRRAAQFARGDRRADDADDIRLVSRHQAEWAVLRGLLQAAIDHQDGERAKLARNCAEALGLIQHAERLLRGFRTRGRLKLSSLHASPETVTTPTATVQRWSRATPSQGPIVAGVTLGFLFQRWRSEATHVAASTIPQWAKAFRDLEEFLGHDDAHRVTREDAVRWKDELVGRGLAPQSINASYIGAPRAIFNFGVANLLVSTNPFARLRLPKARTPRGRAKGFSGEEAKIVLRAARDLRPGREHPHTFRLRKWAPWLCAYTGARIGEVAQLRKKDVVFKDSVWTIHLTPSAGSTKSRLDRIVPLHPQLVEIGFPEMVVGAEDGYLFGHAPEDAGARNRPKVLAMWVRSLGITDLGVTPNHGWRHRFKTMCRRAGVPLEYHNAITGHSNDRSIGNSYGVFPVDALYREICKLPWARL